MAHLRFFSFCFASALRYRDTGNGILINQSSSCIVWNTGAEERDRDLVLETPQFLASQPVSNLSQETGQAQPRDWTGAVSRSLIWDQALTISSYRGRAPCLREECARCAVPAPPPGPCPRGDSKWRCASTDERGPRQGHCRRSA
eukprot:7181665-Prymnesium_polylepis.1